MFQTLVTALIVLGASGYAAWKLMPAGWRRGAARSSGVVARAAGAGDALARRIEIRAVRAAESASGCGQCGPCKGCATGQGTGEPAASTGAPSEGR